MVKLIKTESRIAINLQNKQKKLARVPVQAYDFFYKQTPVRTGNARSKTKLKQDTIRASYPYAGRLDRGWSQQAPKGMSGPTLNFIRRLVRKILGR
jgi:hypothetical protein